ncbi:hypothetical protein GGI13_000754 [Coemansia sp. RSA 455]|nr:hypothetical protein GGI13_000754 [Coemansia sp. RSA 455]
MEDDRRRQEFWQTLLAMGFQGQAACTGAYSGVELDWRVFERGIYHTKAAELILHFLLGRLDVTRTRREFFDCWPIGSPQQAREFRAKAFRWLDEIRHEPGWPSDVPVRRSYVDECRGVRFEAVLWSLAFVSAHTQLRSLGRPLVELTVAERSTGLSLASVEIVREALGRSRMRYGRCTRDRSQAIRQWQLAEDKLRRQIAAAEEGREKAHIEYRSCRKRLAIACPMADVPDVDASAADVERRLSALVAQAKRLWGDCAGWVEGQMGTVDIVESVTECRANSVRLDARRDVRLAPAPAMADAWAKWLAKDESPFKAADVNLHAVAKMASACVGVLRRSVGSPDEPLSLDGASACELSLDAERMARLDTAISAQDARLARLRRLRAQLAEQQAGVARIVRLPVYGEEAPVVGALMAGIRRPAKRAEDMAADVSRAARLAGMWDDLLEADGPALHVVDFAWPERQALVPRLSLSFMSDGGSLFSGAVKRNSATDRPDALKRLRLQGAEDDVPDFLVG